MYSLFVLSIEIFCKASVNMTESIFPLKKANGETAAQRRPAERERKMLMPAPLVL